MSETIKYLPPWKAIGQFADNLVKELDREVTEGHKLWKAPVKAIAQRTDSDDVLFKIEDGTSRCAVVHLTWSGEPEEDPKWPDTCVFDSLETWATECMLADHQKFIGSNE